MLNRVISCFLFFSIFFVPSLAIAQNANDEFELSPEEFFNLDLNVVSPAKKLQKLKNVPSAIYVLTEEDIQRSAATNVMDLLRLVPGIQVTKVSAHEWAITSRGFNQIFADKLLLLIDGTPVETLTFNGVFWENVNIPLDLVERIEIIRGPGAAVWGTRAVNGIIHIITKDAFTHPHNAASVGGGSEHSASAYARFGEVLSEKAAISGHVKFDRHDESQGVDGSTLNDESQILSAGFRGDFAISERDKLRVSANASMRESDIGLSVPTILPPFSERREDEREQLRAYLALQWDRNISDDSQMSFEWTNSYEERDDLLIDSLAFNSDVEFRHRIRLNDTHDLSYGTNLRFYFDNTEGSEIISFSPENRSFEFYRAFIHDEIAIIPNQLKLTLGSRFELNPQVDFNVLPTARVLWNVNEKVSLWSSFSYTTGTPSRVFDDLTLLASATIDPESGLPILLPQIGSRSVDSEELYAYEIGVWAELAKDLYLSATAFYFRYDELISRTAGVPMPVFDPMAPPFIVLPLNVGNRLSADSRGFELAADWTYSPSATFSATYSFIEIDLDDSGSSDEVSINLIDNAPMHAGTIRGHFDLTNNLDGDIVLRYVDEVPNSFRVARVDEYFTVDLQARYYFTPNLELKVIGRNLLEDGHEEFNSISFNLPLSEVERSVYGELRYSF